MPVGVGPGGRCWDAPRWVNPRNRMYGGAVHDPLWEGNGASAGWLTKLPITGSVSKIREQNSIIICQGTGTQRLGLAQGSNSFALHIPMIVTSLGHVIEERLHGPRQNVHGAQRPRPRRRLIATPSCSSCICQSMEFGWWGIGCHLLGLTGPCTGWPFRAPGREGTLASRVCAA